MRLLLAALILFAGAMPAAAQWLDRPWPAIPRTADGKPNLAAPAPRGHDGKPNLTGVWNGPAPGPRPDPADAQPWVNDLVRQRQQEYFKTRPYYQCLPSGPEAERCAGWKRILQTPFAIAILNDNEGEDARPLVPRSQTLFEGLGLGYQCIVDGKGTATDVVEIHISGPWRYPLQR